MRSIGWILAIGSATVLAPLGVSFVTPAFQVAPAPPGVADGAGEPSIGVDWATGKVMFQSFTDTYRVDFTPATPTWTLARPLWSVTNLDPILFTDPATGRTFAGGLDGTCSLLGISDNDGGLWLPAADSCANPGWDHPTVGGGPWAAPLVSAPYPHSVYYCSQTGLSPGPAWCAVSADGGLTFDPATPLWSTQCGGLHGHVKVGPDGAAYVPNSDCGGRQGMAVSTNNGLTWTVRTIPGTTTRAEGDPSIGVGRGNLVAGGRAYFCYQGGDGHAYATSTANKGATWGAKVDLGAAFGLQNVQFPAAVAGDDDRAACAFLGTTTGGDDQASGFTGVWHLYVSFTYDSGATWTTVDVTGSDPVQRGCIWLGGGGNACRNLLDFMDAQLGADGSVYVGFADGCTSPACIAGTTVQHADHGTIARQAGGTRLFA